MIIAHRLLGRSQIFANLQLYSSKRSAQNWFTSSSMTTSTKRCESSLIHRYQAIDVRRPASSLATGFRGVQLFNKTSWMVQQMKISVRFYNQKSWLVRDCKSIDEILQTASKRIDDSLPVPIAAVWSSISRMITRQQFSKHRSTDIIEHQVSVLLRYTCDSLNKSKPKDLSTITLSIAKIVRSIREAHHRRRMNIYHQAFGKVLQVNNSKPDQSILHALAKATDANLHHFDERSFSNTAYAYALLGYDPKIDARSLMQGIADKSIDCIHQFDPQSVSNTLWSYAKLKVDHPQLFQSVGDAVASKLDLNEFIPQNLANIVWAYATTNSQHAGLFQKVGDSIVAKRDLRSFDPQALANIVWAYSTNKSQHHGLFQKVGDSIVARDDLRSFAPQALANIVWAYATNKAQHPGLFQKVGDSIVAITDLRSFNAQNLANIVWAYATNNAHHPNLFQKVGDAIARADGSKVFTTQNLANIVWAYAKLDVKHPYLFNKIGKSIGALDDLSSFESQELANIAWSFAMADVDVPIAFNDVFLRALVEKQNELNLKELTQLYKWHVWQVEKSKKGLPEILRERCEEAISNRIPHRHQLK
eukprot:scaffold30905_cov45-Cyclotella_meneghiniana.AAC.1